jgi:uncharacterized membrane protein
MEWMFTLGFCTGLRAMTPIAVVCWFAWLNRFPVHGTWAAWTGYLVSAIIFSLLALGEYVGDTLPNTPNRTAPGPAISRIVFGALVGAIAATAAMQPLAGGILFGALGAAAGTWGGFHIRRSLSHRVGRDLPVGLFGSAVALVLSFIAARQHAKGISITLEHMPWLPRT